MPWTRDIKAVIIMCHYYITILAYYLWRDAFVNGILIRRRRSLLRLIWQKNKIRSERAISIDLLL